MKKIKIICNLIILFPNVIGGLLCFSCVPETGNSLDDCRTITQWTPAAQCLTPSCKVVFLKKTADEVGLYRSCNNISCDQFEPFEKCKEILCWHNYCNGDYFPQKQILIILGEAVKDLPTIKGHSTTNYWGHTYWPHLRITTKEAKTPKHPKNINEVILSNITGEKALKNNKGPGGSSSMYLSKLVDITHLKNKYQNRGSLEGPYLGLLKKSTSTQVPTTDLLELPELPTTLVHVEVVNQEKISLEVPVKPSEPCGCTGEVESKPEVVEGLVVPNMGEVAPTTSPKGEPVKGGPAAKVERVIFEEVVGVTKGKTVVLGPAAKVERVIFEEEPPEYRPPEVRPDIRFHLATGAVDPSTPAKRSFQSLSLKPGANLWLIIFLQFLNFLLRIFSLTQHIRGMVVT